MKRLLFTAILIAFSLISYAQDDVTKFLGIPVDGTKTEMIQKLIEKGFTYDKYNDCLMGEFNGQDVNVYIVTNKNKVYRIMIAYKNTCNESQIKIKFNNLYYQFKNNSKYARIDDFEIPENEDISYEMTVNNKNYEATFLQRNKNGELTEDALNRPVWFIISQFNSKYYINIYYDNLRNQANGEDL